MHELHGGKTSKEFFKYRSVIGTWHPHNEWGAADETGYCQGVTHCTQSVDIQELHTL